MLIFPSRASARKPTRSEVEHRLRNDCIEQRSIHCCKTSGCHSASHGSAGCTRARLRWHLGDGPSGPSTGRPLHDSRGLYVDRGYCRLGYCSDSPTRTIGRVVARACHHSHQCRSSLLGLSWSAAPSSPTSPRSYFFRRCSLRSLNSSIRSV